VRSIRPIECGAWMCATEQLGTTYSVRTRWVVNAAGTWTDAVNPRRFGVESPYKQGLEGGVTASEAGPTRRVPEGRAAASAPRYSVPTALRWTPPLK
jgi:hypothetical protein